MFYSQINSTNYGHIQAFHNDSFSIIIFMTSIQSNPTFQSSSLSVKYRRQHRQYKIRSTGIKNERYSEVFKPVKQKRHTFLTPIKSGFQKPVHFGVVHLIIFFMLVFLLHFVSRAYDDLETF